MQPIVQAPLEGVEQALDVVAFEAREDDFLNIGAAVAVVVFQEVNMGAAPTNTPPFAQATAVGQERPLANTVSFSYRPSPSVSSNKRIWPSAPCLVRSSRASRRRTCGRSRRSRSPPGLSPAAQRRRARFRRQDGLRTQQVRHSDQAGECGAIAIDSSRLRLPIARASTTRRPTQRNSPAGRAAIDNQDLLSPRDAPINAGLVDNHCETSPEARSLSTYRSL